MKTILKISLLILVFTGFYTLEAQTTKSDKKSGSAIITHSNTYGAVNILETSNVKVGKNNEGYNIHGSWWTMEADIHDGFYLTINSEDELRHDTVESKEDTKRTFKIPEEATLKLSYDPMLPYYRDNGNDFKKAVTDEYQTYDVSKGSVTIDVLDERNIQISFNGKVTHRKVVRHSNNSEDYSETFHEASITGGIDNTNVSFINNSSITKDTTNESSNEASYNYNTSENTSATPGVYQFNFETVVEVTSSEQNRSHKMSYLINSNANYIAIIADMSEYSDESMGGESIIVVDGNDTHIFVDTAGMKMQMSQNMMGGNAPANPADQMAAYDYSNLKKTGNTKTILGATCYEYTMSDASTQMILWVAPSVNLPNWFVQNQEVLNGHIMEYTVNSKEGNMKSKIIEIHDNISKIIDSKEYRKMF